MFYPTFVWSSQSVVIDTTVKISVCGNNIAEDGEYCDNSDLQSKTCENLGFLNGSLSCSSSCEFITSSCVSKADFISTIEVERSLGLEHRIKTDNKDKAKIVFPQEVYEDNLIFESFLYPNDFFNDSKPALEDKSFVGKSYDFIFINNKGETVSSLNKNVSITLFYEDEDIAGLNEDSIKPYHWGSRNTSWDLISDYSLNTNENQITFSSKSFSSFALMGGGDTQSSEKSYIPSVYLGSFNNIFNFSDYTKQSNYELPIIFNENLKENEISQSIINKKKTVFQGDNNLILTDPLFNNYSNKNGNDIKKITDNTHIELDPEKDNNKYVFKTQDKNYLIFLLIPILIILFFIFKLKK